MSYMDGYWHNTAKYLTNITSAISHNRLYSSKGNGTITDTGMIHIVIQDKYSKSPIQN